MGELWEEPDCELKAESQRIEKERERRTEEHPGLIESWRISVLRRGQKAFVVNADLFTRRKTEKTGVVNTDGVWQPTDSLHVFLPLQAYLIYTAVKIL